MPDDNGSRTRQDMRCWNVSMSPNPSVLMSIRILDYQLLCIGAEAAMEGDVTL